MKNLSQHITESFSKRQEQVNLNELYVVTKDFIGDINKWRKGDIFELTNKKSSQGKLYKFIVSPNPNIESYDDVEISVLDTNSEKFDSEKHKAATNNLKKWGYKI